MKELFINVLPAVIAVISTIIAFIEKHKEELGAIIKKVEADSSDGTWTKEEKLGLVRQLLEKNFYPNLPIYVKIVPKHWIISWAMTSIKKICAKAKLL